MSIVGTVALARFWEKCKNAFALKSDVISGFKAKDAITLYYILNIYTAVSAGTCATLQGTYTSISKDSSISVPANNSLFLRIYDIPNNIYPFLNWGSPNKGLVIKPCISIVSGNTYYINLELINTTDSAISVTLGKITAMALF